MFLIGIGGNAARNLATLLKRTDHQERIVSLMNALIESATVYAKEWPNECEAIATIRGYETSTKHDG